MICAKCSNIHAQPKKHLLSVKINQNPERWPESSIRINIIETYKGGQQHCIACLARVLHFMARRPLRLIMELLSMVFMLY